MNIVDVCKKGKEYDIYLLGSYRLLVSMTVAAGGSGSPNNLPRLIEYDQRCHNEIAAPDYETARLQHSAYMRLVAIGEPSKALNKELSDSRPSAMIVKHQDT